MKKYILLSLAGAIALSAQSQSSTKFINTADSINIYNIMIENAPGRPKIKDVPRFTLVGKDNKFYLGMGANLKFVADFDWGAPVADANNFVPAKIPMMVDPGKRSQTLMSIGQSNIYWNFVMLPGSKYQVGVFLDINFLGTNNKTVALHHGYLKFCGITAGYVVSTFTDLKAEPAAIDFAGPNAITFVRHPNISYNHKFGKDKMWSAQIGLDLPDVASITYSSVTNEINQKMPDIPLFIQRAWANNNGWLRFSAIFRNLQYRSEIYEKSSVNESGNKGVFGWGVKVSGRSPICGGLSASWQAVYGKGVSSYISDLSGEKEDLVPDAGNANKLVTLPTWGAYGSLRYDFSKRVFMDFTYSQVRAYAKDFGSGWGDLYKYGQYLTANLFVNITDFAQFGVEYLYGKRVNYNNERNHDNRLMLMLNVSI